MENINICKGVPCDASCSACEKRATIVNTTKFDYRKRSNTCKKFLSVGSKLELCEPCAQKQKRGMEVQNCITSNDQKRLKDLLKEKTTVKLIRLNQYPRKFQSFSVII